MASGGYHLPSEARHQPAGCVPASIFSADAWSLSVFMISLS